MNRKDKDGFPIPCSSFRIHHLIASRLEYFRGGRSRLELRLDSGAYGLASARATDGLKNPYNIAMPLQPLDYEQAPAETAAARHNRIYMSLLLAAAFLCLAETLFLIRFSRRPSISPEAAGIFKAETWLFGAYAVAIVLTFIIRLTAPRAARVTTMALNIVLLILVPFGTAIGIYGLMKVDKHRPSGGA